MSDDVGHTLVLGATGAGKSFLLNFIVTHAQKYDPVTTIFDLGGSYREADDAARRQHVAHGPRASRLHDQSVLSGPHRRHPHFLFPFVRVLLQSSGQYQLTMTDDRDLYEAIENLYALDPPQRRLITLANTLPRSLAQHLHRWVQGGPYANPLRQRRGHADVAARPVFRLRRARQVPAAAGAAAVLRPASRQRVDPRRGARRQLKLFVLDEAWRFAQDATLKAYITEALKTWRKRNAAMILATQSSEDLRTRAICCGRWWRAARRSSFSRIRGWISTARAQLFHLNQTEAALIAHLVPRQQVLLKRPDVAKVLNLHVDPSSYWIYTNTPDRQRPCPRRYGR